MKPSSQPSPSPESAESADLLDMLEKSLTVAGQSDNSLPSRIRAIGEAAATSDAIFSEWLPNRDDRLCPDSGEKRLTTKQVSSQVAIALNRATQLLHRSLLPALANEQIWIASLDGMDAGQRTWLRSTFTRQLFPLLIPLAVDPGRPFPQINGSTLNLLVVLRGHARDVALDGPALALVEVPESLDRWLPVRSIEDHDEPSSWFSMDRYQPGTYAWSEEVMRACVDLLFPGMVVDGSFLFRVLYAHTNNVTKNSAFAGRDPSPAVARLDVEEAMPVPVRRWLIRHLNPPDHTVMRSLPPMALGDLIAMADRLPAREGRVQRWLRAAWQSLFGHI